MGTKIAFFKIWFWLNDRDYSPTDYFRLEDACNSRGNFNGGYHYFARVNYDELGVEEEIAIIDGKTPITKKEGVSLDKIYWLCENEKNCNSCRNKSDKAEIIISFKKRTTKELKTNKVDNPVRDINKTAETGVYLGDKPDVTKPIKTTCSYKEPIKVPTAAEINSRCGCSLTDADIQNEVVRATQDIKNFYKNNSKTQKCFYYKGWKDTRDDFMNRKKCNELPWYEIVLANTCCPD